MISHSTPFAGSSLISSSCALFPGQRIKGTGLGIPGSSCVRFHKMMTCGVS